MSFGPGSVSRLHRCYIVNATRECAVRHAPNGRTERKDQTLQATAHTLQATASQRVLKLNTPTVTTWLFAQRLKLTELSRPQGARRYQACKTTHAQVRSGCVAARCNSSARSGFRGHALARAHAAGLVQLRLQMQPPATCAQARPAAPVSHQNKPPP